MEKKQTPLGLGENVEGALAYVLVWVTGILFLVLEPKNEYIRFHAMQSVVTFGALTLISVVLGAIPVVGWILAILLAPVELALWILLVYNAYMGERFVLPIAGDIAEQLLGRL